MMYSNLFTNLSKKHISIILLNIENKPLLEITTKKNNLNKKIFRANNKSAAKQISLQFLENCKQSGISLNSLNIKDRYIGKKKEIYTFLLKA